MLCLEVLEERGLISLNRRTDRVQITLCHVENKVDLEASEIIKRLRAILEDGL
jgi:single-stranded-DNA-specific exonuclease